MYTYNDLKQTSNITLFVEDVIKDHEGSEIYRNGRKAGLFYRHIDEDLEQIKKYVYDRDNVAHYDDVSPNHKLTSNMFHFFITQLVSYQLGNGVSFDDESIKEQLGGAEFDYILQDVLTYAACDGESYGYVTDDKIYPFCAACKINGDEPLLIALKDENDGKIKAAVQYWRLAADKPMRATLFEIDGYTEFKEFTYEDGKTGFEIFEEKKPYKQTVVKSENEGTIAVKGENYSSFPIVSMRFINGQSSIVGNEALLFAYDIVLSGMVNNVDMNTVYWVLKNADGMDKRDDLNFVADMINSKVIHANEGIDIQKEEIQSRHDAYISVLSMLRHELFTNFQAVDVESISAANKTTVEIKASYQNLNLKCDEIEKYLDRFIRECLRLKGLDVNAKWHYKRPNDVNMSEMLTSIMQVAPLLGEDTALKLVCETLGLIDEYENIKEQKAVERVAMMNAVTE